MRSISFLCKVAGVFAVSVFIAIASISSVYAGPIGFQVGSITAVSGSGLGMTRISVEVTPGSKPVDVCVLVVNSGVSSTPLVQDTPVLGSSAFVYTNEYSLSSGTYVLRVQCTDTVGAVANSPELSFTVASTDMTAPVVVTPSRSSTVYPGQIVPLTMTFSDASQVADCSFWLNGTRRSAVYQNQSTGSMNVGLSTSDLTYGISNAYRFSCVDIHGNEGFSATRFLEIAPDTDPPSVTNTGLTSGLVNVSQSITASYTDNAGITECTLIVTTPEGLAGAPMIMTRNGLATNGTLFRSHTFTSTGDHTVTIGCVDGAGHIGVAAWLFTVTSATPTDTTNPVVTNLLPGTAVKDSAVLLSAQYSDAGGIASCQLLVNGVAINAVRIGTGQSGSLNGSYTFTSTGSHIVRFSCQDMAGNIGYAERVLVVSEPVSVTPPPVTPTTDTTPPTLTSLAPATAIRGVPTTLSVAYADAVGVTSCSVYVNGSLAGPATLSSVQSGAATRTHTFSSAGTYMLKIECRDAAGNLRDSSAAVVVSEPVSVPVTPVTPTPVTTTPTPVTTTPIPVTTTPAPVTTTSAPATSAPTRSLIKLACPGYVVAADHACKAVYYYGLDGKRHAFPNAQVYFTWYQDFFGVVEVSPGFMASIPLGKNVTYRPGVRMVKFTTLDRVYAVGRGGVLRWVTTEDVARGIYGATWTRQIDDIADIFFTDYVFGTDVTTPGGFAPQSETLGTVTVDQNW